MTRQLFSYWAALGFLLSLLANTQAFSPNHVGPPKSRSTPSWLSANAVPKRGLLVSLETKSNPDNNENDKDNENEPQVKQSDAEITKPDNDEIPPLPTLDASVIIPYILFVSFWPLLALVRLQWDGYFDGGNPVELFDIDKYMALQDMMQDADSAGGNNEITELPALSPAEQMIGAIFGPPSPR